MKKVIEGILIFGAIAGFLVWLNNGTTGALAAQELKPRVTESASAATQELEATPLPVIGECPGFLADDPGTCISVADVQQLSLPHMPAHWSYAQQQEEGVVLQAALFATMHDWDREYPDTVPPVGFPDEVWVVVMRVTLPVENGFVVYNPNSYQATWQSAWFNGKLLQDPPDGPQHIFDSGDLVIRVSCADSPTAGSMNPYAAFTVPAQLELLADGSEYQKVPRSERFAVLFDLPERGICSYP